MGVLVLLDSHLGDGRVADLRRRGVVPLRMLGGGVGVEVPLLAVAEDPFLCVVVVWVSNKVGRRTKKIVER